MKEPQLLGREIHLHKTSSTGREALQRACTQPPLVLVRSLPDSQSPGSFVYHSVNRRQKTQSVSHVASPNVQQI